MMTTNNQAGRMVYDNAKKVFFDAWIDNFLKANNNDFGRASAACKKYVDSLKLAPSEIRLETTLDTVNSVFTFGVTPNQANNAGTVFKTEQRLQMQDNLVVAEYGIYVAQTAGATDTAFDLNTYGNGNVFAVADAAALNTTFYSNGQFALKCNNDVIIPSRGILNHKYIPQTQQIAALGAAAVHSQICGAVDGVVTMEPNFLLSGQKNNVPQIILPGALASMAANARVILIFKGLLAQNSTVVS
jgi:hypothetical protein